MSKAVQWVPGVQCIVCQQFLPTIASCLLLFPFTSSYCFLLFPSCQLRSCRQCEPKRHTCSWCVTENRKGNSAPSQTKLHSCVYVCVLKHATGMCIGIGSAVCVFEACDRNVHTDTHTALCVCACVCEVCIRIGKRPKAAHDYAQALLLQVQVSI